MAGQSASVSALGPNLTSDRAGKTAVVLNTHARQVDENVVRLISQVLPREDLFVSRSEHEVRWIAQTLLEKKYATVFCGGGDGTFMALVNELFSAAERQRPNSTPLPRLGLLKLGTGNSLASMLGASSVRGGKFLTDLLRAMSKEVPGYRRLEMLELDGKRAIFAGLGCDGQILNDYFWLRKHLAKGVFRNMLTGIGGYFASAALRTLPYYLAHSTWTECEVINGRSVAYQLAPDGSSVGDAIAPGATLFRGRINLAAASTIPFYGFNFRMFPFAGRRLSMMHLRLAAVSGWSALVHLPQMWRGQYFDNHVHDFHVSEATIQFSQPMPLQIGGDAAGYKRRITLRMARESLELLDFSGQVH